MLASLKNDDKQSDNSDDDDDGDDQGSEEGSWEGNAFNADDWSFCKVPKERVFLFPGAESSKVDNDDDDDVSSADVTFHEVAHCDGCSGRIYGTIQKCVECFDYDLCQDCYPSLSKSHCNGEHVFQAEPAAPAPN